VKLEVVMLFLRQQAGCLGLPTPAGRLPGPMGQQLRSFACYIASMGPAGERSEIAENATKRVTHSVLECSFVVRSRLTVEEVIPASVQCGAVWAL
jgi:hypothetical protein